MIEMVFIHYLLQAILLSFNLYVAIKALVGSNDHNTYMVHCYYFCILIGTTLFIV